MDLISFAADNATDALAQVHQRLGPDAVIFSVRPLPVHGLGRLWNKKGRIEVAAGLPDAPEPDSEPRRPNIESEIQSSKFTIPAGRWRSVAWLEWMGLLPAHAARLQGHLQAAYGDAPDSPEREWQAVRGALERFWPLENDELRTTNGDSNSNFEIRDSKFPRPHVFVGPPGSGKTTALCKWLTQAVLLDGRAARVWRLDGSAANTAEFLAIHCETLGVPLARFWTEPVQGSESRVQGSNTSASNPEPQTLDFIDLPGVEITDAAGLAALRGQLASFPAPRVHLVLNAAYEMPALMAQWRAFEPCAPTDLIFTHLDEERRRVKLWNFVFGTNCSVRFLGAGQKIPGEFRRAAPGLLLPAETL